MVFAITPSGDGTCLIRTPYNEWFTKRMKNIGGRWDRESSGWIVPSDTIDSVRELMKRCFGRDDAPWKTADVKITAKDDIYEGDTFGYTIAQISHRDSGAWIPKSMKGSVSILDGNIGSGGSARNPHVTIDEGTVFLIRDVPLEAIKKRLGLNDKWEVEVIERKPSKQVLLEEKERLLSRIEEIDIVLNKINESV